MDILIILVLMNVNLEFLLASTNKKKILSRENLKKAFQLFDKVKGKYNLG